MSKTLHVLFIEDSEDDMLLLLQEFRRGKYTIVHERVETAAAITAALAKKTWDVVIADYLLPTLSAPEALEILQASGLDLPFIVVSGSIGEDVAVTVMKAGAHDYLLKGNLKRFIPAVERELREVENRNQKRQAEAALLEAFNKLESLVEIRTAELVRVNEELQAEVEERIKAEQALFQLAAIVQSSEDAIISTSLDGRVLSWNPGAEKLYGYLAEEAEGQFLDSLIQPNSDFALQVLQIKYPVETVDHRQTMHKRKDGEVIDVFMIVSPIRDASGRIAGMSMISTDISDRRTIDRIKDELISIVSHELRTPITSLQASIDLLLTGQLGDLSDSGRQMLEIAANNIDRLVHVTNNILDLERFASGTSRLYKQPCNVTDLLTHAMSEMQDVAGKAGVTLHVSPLFSEIQADPKRIIQVLANLLSNAIKFSAPGGRIWLSAEIRREDTNPTARAQPIPFPYLLITVKDEGEGIPIQNLDTIFEQFEQVDASDSRRQGGAGLGLAVCRSIVRQHQGNLWVESELGRGSTFYVALPLGAKRSGDIQDNQFLGVMYGS
ncbi:hypothetical protein BST81_13505 [Leptolyngbya sp. 'hensonii']|uniref:ATP-binding response regulator n=1 Tax=Leptolyngbya sp. 'hensonii' TaxID=1922337 RepID=UPI00094F8D3D|nr:ATP-binding protein [Leptolyngbya sp. 'hensonii']OLP18043.1 hypothetical protein BST81_13505 [Leptolyngbya sp. 'hensonii']